MASRGNQTCMQLHNVVKTGFAHHTSSILVKGAWYPLHFTLAVTDGLNAWKIDVTEAFVIQCANDMKVTAGQYVDKAHLHLGHDDKSSLYSLHCLGSKGAQLLCTPRDGRDLNMEFTINLPMKAVPVLDLTFDMVQFLMQAYQDLLEKADRKSRAHERAKATIEQCVEDLQSQKAQLQCEKAQLEIQIQSIKVSGMNFEGDDMAIVAVPSSSTLKRKVDSSVENNVQNKRASWKGRSPWNSMPPPKPDEFVAGMRNRASTRVRGTTAPLTTRREGSRTGNGHPPLSDEFSGGNREQKAGEKSYAKLLPTSIPDGSLDACPNSASNALLKTGKKRGRKPKGTVLLAQDTDDRLPSVRKCGGAQRDSSMTRDMISEHRIEEQAERAIKLLEPYTRQLAILGARRTDKSLSPRAAGKTLGRNRGTIHASTNDDGRLQLRQPSVDMSPQSSVALPLAFSRGKVTDTMARQTKEFDVINTDFYDFDNERSKYVMGLGQYWALYDNMDGMPRFYGRIVNLTLDPFEAEVESLKPYRPTLLFSGLVKSAGLSVACGEFKRDTVNFQELAAFSHRVEVEADAKRRIYRINPRKGEVWALYKEWDKILSKQYAEDDVPKFGYDLVEVLSEFSKEKGVKVGPITKVPGFKTVFKSGGSMSPHWIPAKDFQSIFSHQIATHRFDGSETRVVPRGSFGLDSASTPEEFMSSMFGAITDTPFHAMEVTQTISESG